MNNIVEAEYTILQERTLPVIISEIHIIEQKVAKEALEGAVQIGVRLQEAKEKVGHGNFETWCRENLNYSKRTAENFMRVAREYGGENGLFSKTQALADFSITKALSLLKVPEEDREKFIEEHEIEDMTTRELEEEIKKLNEEKESRTRTINEMDRSLQREAEQLAEAQHEIETLKRQLQDAEKNAADAAEIEILKEKLGKEKTKAREAQEKLKKEKAARQTEIDAAIAKKQEELQKEAETKAGKVLQKAEEERKGLQSENEALKRKLANAGNESIVKFKIMVDQLQDIFDQCGQCILVEQDHARSEKMNAALRQVVEKFREDLRMKWIDAEWESEVEE